MQFTVDRDFVRVGDKSFAVRQINSVEILTTTKMGSSSYRAWWTIAVIFVLMLVFSLAVAPEGAGFSFLFLLLFGILGYRSYKNRHTLHSYRLSLVTSSGENTALTTTDRDLVEQMRGSIEQAIVSRASAA